VDYEQITREQRDDVVVLTLNRPERLNAWTPRMSTELTHAIEQADADPAIGAVVVTGTGRAFCAGADIAAVFNTQLEGGEAPAEPAEAPRRHDWVDVVRRTKPLVAAVNGVAVGVGLTMILPFDRIMTCEGARFSLRFVKMGLVPELASSYFVPQRVGFGVASDLMLSGRMVDAAEAVAIGLADELVPAESLVDDAVARARTYGENPSPQLRWIKQLLTTNASEGDPAVVQEREGAMLQLAYASAEHKEAVSAFLEKRPPKFR
jgi:2-(1,2-epoxy-1,2-dihydrophenyl)acetyl-CoA isomerase